MGMLLLASVVLTSCFPTLRAIINEDTFHPNHLLSSLHPPPPFQAPIFPSVHVPVLEGVSPSQAALSSAERHCCRSGTVRPPSFHAPLALMCAHVRGIMGGHSNTQLMRSFMFSEPCTETINTVTFPALQD